MVMANSSIKCRLDGMTFRLVLTVLFITIAFIPAAAGDDSASPATGGQARSEGDIRFLLTTEFEKGSFEETPVSLLVRIRLEDLQLEDQGWRKRGSVRITGEVRGRDDTVLVKIDRTQRIFRLPADLDTDSSAFESVEFEIKLKPGRHTLHLLVQDTGITENNAPPTGELEIPLIVPIRAGVDVPLTAKDLSSVSVTLLEPWHGDWDGLVRLLADVRVREDDSVALVKFVVDGVEVNSLTEPPFSIEYPIEETDNDHVIQVIALTANGHRGTDTFNTSLAGTPAGAGLITGAPPAPMTVSITTLRENDLVSGPTLLEAVVEGVPESDLSRIEFLVDGEIVATVTTPPFQTTWNPGNATGEHVLEVLAYDIEGRRAVSRLTVTAMVTDLAERVERVLLSATIRDRMGKLVPDVTPEELLVLEDGVEQEVIEVDIETRPVRMAILIDGSGSMENKLAQAQQAAKNFLRTLKPEDRAMVVSFSSDVQFLQHFTGDQIILSQAIERTRAEGGTAMYDALVAAMEKFGPPSDKERKVVVLLSDGADSASKNGSEAVLEAAREKEVMIYSIGFTQGMNTARRAAHAGQGSSPYSTALNQREVGEAALRGLSDESGGRVFLVNSANELAETYEEIATELRNQFVIVYRPENPDADGSWRDVDVRPRKKREYRIRTKKGYHAR